MDDVPRPPIAEGRGPHGPRGLKPSGSWYKHIFEVVVARTGHVD